MQRTNRSDQKQRILRAAASLFLEAGFKNTSTSQIAARARVSKRAIYTQFQSKENLFMSCAEDIFREMFAHVWRSIGTETDNRERLRKRTVAFFEEFESWWPMMNLVKGLSASPDSVFHDEFKAVLFRMTAPLAAEHELPPAFRVFGDDDRDRQFYAFAMLGAVEAVFVKEATSGAVFDEGRFQQATDLLR